MSEAEEERCNLLWKRCLEQLGWQKPFDRLIKAMYGHLGQELTDELIEQAYYRPPVYDRAMSAARGAQTWDEVVVNWMQSSRVLHERISFDEAAWLSKQDRRTKALNGALHPKLRQAVLADNPTCVYCKGEPSVEVDHVTPRSQGGDNRRSNLVGSCKRCNLSKGGRTPSQWRDRAQEQADDASRKLRHAQLVLECLS